MKIDLKDFLVKQGQQVILDQWPTLMKPLYKDKKHSQEHLEKHKQELHALQDIHFASGAYPILIIFQGMDASGKDGAIRHVMSGINPQGCQVTSFKHPQGVELAHDYLWRYIQYLPERGRIGIFNRSYYEEVLIVRVHPEILEGQGIPSKNSYFNTIWQDRYHSINHLEKYLTHNGTKIIKFFLHISQEEQKRRFLDRIEQPHKNWKITRADMEERNFWNDYMFAYGQCLSKTSTDHSPWYIIPADDKENSRLIISYIILEAFKELIMEYPKMSIQRLEELESFRKILLAK